MLKEADLRAADQWPCQSVCHVQKIDERLSRVHPRHCRRDKECSG